MFRNLFAAAILLSICAPAAAQDSGLVAGSVFASSNNCGTAILVTGQFLAPSEGYTVSLVEAPDQTATILALDVEATPPTASESSSETLIPFSFKTTDPHPCPYGVTVSYNGQVVLVGGLIAKIVEPRD